VTDVPFSLDDLIRAVLTLADEPLDQLAEAARLKDDLADEADALLGHFVDRARRSGASWSQIGDALGVSKQAAQQRHGTEVDEPQPRWRKRMFTRFTGRARSAIDASHEEARRLGHGFVGTEHLLLGVLRQDASLGAVVLTELGVDLARARADVEGIVGRGGGAGRGQPPFTPRAKRALELALREALALGHNYIGTEHLVLALVTIGEGVAHEVLSAAGIEADMLRARFVSRLLGGWGQSAGGPQPC
jgi:hypothetical protein